MRTYQSFKPFKEFSPGFGCRGICETSELTIIPKRHKGYTCQEHGIRYCKRCAVYFKPEAGIYCPCCKQRLKGRIDSKQSRIIRERNQKTIECYRYVCQDCDFKTGTFIESSLHIFDTEFRHKMKDLSLEHFLLSAKAKN